MDICWLSLPGKVHAKCLENKSREIVKPQFQAAQCRFLPGRLTMKQIFALQQVLRNRWNMPDAL